MENDLVFIVGLPRTGSTLLRTLLNRSDRICICGETHFLHNWARLGRKKDSKINKYGNLQNAKSVDGFLDVIYSSQAAADRTYWPWLNKNVPKEQFRQRLIESDRSDRAIFELLMRFFAEKKKGEIRPDLILGEKTPANLDYVPTLMRWFPQAKIIHTFRDPRAIYVSAVKLARASKWGWKDKLQPLPNVFMNPAVEVSMAVYILRAWLSASSLHANYAKQYPGRYYLVRFEDFLERPETVLRDLCEFLNVPFQPNMLEDVAIIESSFNEQRIVKDGIDKDVADRWKGHIHPVARVMFSTLGKRQLENFGYSS